MISFTIGFFSGALIGLSGYVVGFLSSKSLLEDKNKSLESNLDLQDDIIRKNLPPIELQVSTQPKAKETIKLPLYVADFIKMEKAQNKSENEILYDTYNNELPKEILPSVWFNYCDLRKWLKRSNNAEKFFKAVIFDDYEIEE